MQQMSLNATHAYYNVNLADTNTIWDFDSTQHAFVERPEAAAVRQATVHVINLPVRLQLRSGTVSGRRR